jgi:glycosyltransferase involved in cell wall biosynthesis
MGDAGLLVNPHDLNDLKAALEQVLSDKGLQEKLGAQSIERASHFSLEKMAAETLEVYREVAEWRSDGNP